MVVGARARHDLETHVLEVRVEVVVDAEGVLQRPVRTVAVEDEEVDVPVRDPRRLDDQVVGHGLALRGAHGPTGLAGTIVTSEMAMSTSAKTFRAAVTVGSEPRARRA